MKKVFIFMFATVAIAAVMVSCKPPVEPDPDPVPRNAILLEYFTTQLCSNCPPAAKKVAAAVAENEGKIALVAHHVGYYTDIMTIAESKPLMFFYQTAGSYAPAAMINRTMLKNQSKVMFNPNTVTITPTLVQEMLNEPTYVSLDLTTSYDAATRNITVNVSGKLLKEYPNAYLTVYLVQDNIKASQSGSDLGNQYVHRNVLRAKISGGDAFGESLDVTKGEYSKSYTYNLPEKITSGDGSNQYSQPTDIPTDVANTYIIAFISEKNNVQLYAEAGNNKVLNAAIKKLQ